DVVADSGGGLGDRLAGGAGEDDHGSHAPARGLRVGRAVLRTVDLWTIPTSAISCSDAQRSTRCCIRVMQPVARSAGRVCRPPTDRVRSGPWQGEAVGV